MYSIGKEKLLLPLSPIPNHKLVWSALGRYPAAAVIYKKNRQTEIYSSKIDSNRYRDVKS